MSNFAGPKIARDSSLIINIDAANTKSYIGTGSSWRDLTQNKAVGTMSNCTFNSLNGGSIVFNGTSSVVYYPSNSNYSFGTGNFTIESFCQVNLKTNSRPIAQNDAVGTSQNDKWWLAYDATAAGLRFGRHFTPTYASCAWNPTSGQWYHVAAVRSSNLMYFYIDGVSQSVTNQTSMSGVSFSQNGLSVGGLSTPYYLNGNIAAFRMYNRGLSATEIYNNYISSRQRFLPQYYPSILQTMEGNLNNTGKDSAVTVTGAGTYSFTSSQFYEGSQSLDITTNGYYDIGSHTIGTGAFVIDMWYKSNGLYTSQSYYSALFSDTASVLYIGSSSYWQAVNAKVTRMTIGTTNIDTTTSVHQNAWTRITVGRDSNGYIYLYINGTLQGRAYDVTSITNPIRVGKWGGNTLYDNKSSGYIDNFRLYKGSYIDFQTIQNIANGY